MVWLVIAEGLPIGSWRIKIRHSGICPLCDGNIIQTPEHTFFCCPAMSNAWTRLRKIRALVGKNPGLQIWDEVLYGDLGKPLPPGREVQMGNIL
jgi:hypothetical protein